MITVKQLSRYVLLASSITIAALETVVAQTEAKEIKNVVLVHSAFADGSSWSKFFTELYAKGYNIAVQNPLSSFSDNVAATNRVITQMDGPVRLVGQTHAGLVISKAGKEKVAGLIYDAASILEEGQIVNDIDAAVPLTVGPEFQDSPDDCLSLSLKGHQ